MNDGQSNEPQTSQHPAAQIVDVGHASLARNAKTSRMWWAALACAVVAAGLVWSEWSAHGTHIDIVFTEGHGLKPGDAVRYLGIDVGEVQAVVLDKDLQRVRVGVEFIEEAAGLARAGTQFWIERADLSIGRARGLDTLVGGHYVGVAPGPPDGPRAIAFTGLDDPPASLHDAFEGLEILLESPQRFGLQRGSPVSYRGVAIGHVMSVGLANDAATVVARTHIQPEYRSLVRDNSQFWSNSGIDIKLGLGGLELDAETLATIAAGGVALATPGEPGSAVTTGHRFDLSKSPKEEWLRWQPHLAIGSAVLPPDAPMPQPVMSARQAVGGFHVFGRTQQRGWVLRVEGDRALGPADLLATDAECALEAWGEEFPLTEEGLISTGQIAVRTLTPKSPTTAPWQASRMRVPDAPEDVVVTCGSDNLTMTLAKQRLEPSDEGWRVDDSTPCDEGWHGAVAVAVRDGALVGVLVYHDGKASIVPLSDELIVN
ncbi:MAG: MCE family protein [Planctomycetales bacterium]|nr:MCE family protein [Planctomycetales bacterium]